MSVRLRVHITTIGFEVRRITEPLKEMRADKVYFISAKKNDRAKNFKERIKEILHNEYSNVEIEERFAEIFDLYACIDAYRVIFNEEKGNMIFVNVSTGSKIAAIAGTIACMLWGGTPYYVNRKYEEEGEPEVKDEKVEKKPNLVPVFSITKPRREYLKILKILDKEEDGMAKGTLIDSLKEVGIIREIKSKKHSVKRTQPRAAEHSQLKVLLTPMANEEYIKIETSGRRSIVRITPKGRDTLRILGAD